MTSRSSALFLNAVAILAVTAGCGGAPTMSGTGGGGTDASGGGAAAAGGGTSATGGGTDATGGGTDATGGGTVATGGGTVATGGGTVATGGGTVATGGGTVATGGGTNATGGGTVATGGGTVATGGGTVATGGGTVATGGGTSASGGGTNGSGGGTTSDAGIVVRPLGTVTVTQQTATCAPGAGTGATCMAVSITCPDVPDLAATLAIAEPSGTAKGTIIAHAGGDGTGYFSAGEAGKKFNTDFTAAGFRYVQIAWASPGWATGGNIKASGCRPATLFKWVFDNLHIGAHAKPFCGISSSGGTAAVTYSMTSYGLKDTFDYLVMAAGPTPSRIDYGCEPRLYSGPARDLCPLLPDAPWTYDMGVSTIADGWTATHSCGKDAGTASDIQTWHDDSLLSDGDDLTYPQTGMSFWYCTTTPNESTGMATFYIDAVHPKVTPDVNCYAGTCTDEYVFDDANAHALALTEMNAGCVVNH